LKNLALITPGVEEPVVVNDLSNIGSSWPLLAYDIHVDEDLNVVELWAISLAISGEACNT